MNREVKGSPHHNWRGRIRGLDGLLEHEDALSAHPRQRWSDLFGAKSDVLLYDITSTYFECDVPEDQTDPRRFG